MLNQKNKDYVEIKVIYIFGVIINWFLDYEDHHRISKEFFFV